MEDPTIRDVVLYILLTIIIALDLVCKAPQIIKLIKYKRSDGISTPYYLLWIISSALYIPYCLIIGEHFLIIETSLNILLNIWIMVLAIHYRKNNRKKRE